MKISRAKHMVVINAIVLCYVISISLYSSLIQDIGATWKFFNVVLALCMLMFTLVVVLFDMNNQK